MAVLPARLITEAAMLVGSLPCTEFCTRPVCFVRGEWTGRGKGEKREKGLSKSSQSDFSDSVALRE